MSEKTKIDLVSNGFIFGESAIRCGFCRISIDLSEVDFSTKFAQNSLRKLHRRKVEENGKLCPFLLCFESTNFRDLTRRSENFLDDAEFPEFGLLKNRIESFRSWPRSSKNFPSLDVSKLCESGFFYIGSLNFEKRKSFLSVRLPFSGVEDRVRCFYCGNLLTDLKDISSSNETNLVDVEHARFFPCCFLENKIGHKIIGEILHFRRPSIEGNHRTSTFFFSFCSKYDSFVVLSCR